MDFVSWIKMILKNQEFCFIKGGETTKYFKLKRSTQQGDPISVHLFIPVLEMLFIFLKNNPKHTYRHLENKFREISNKTSQT